MTISIHLPFLDISRRHRLAFSLCAALAFLGETHSCLGETTLPLYSLIPAATARPQTEPSRDTFVPIQRFFAMGDLASEAEKRTGLLLQKRLPDGGEIVTQQTYLQGSHVMLQTEMGDLSVDGTLLTANSPRKGARFSIASAGPGGTSEMNTFMLADPNGPGVAVGATGKISLADLVQLGTTFVSQSESVKGKNGMAERGRKGEKLGLSAAFEPYRGKLKFHGEVDIAAYQDDTGANKTATDDVAYSAGANGETSGYRYSLLYEKAGPQFRPMGESSYGRDREGYALAVGKNFGIHAIDVKLSRYNNNVNGNTASSTVYRYEGNFEYNLRLAEKLSAGLQLKRKLVMSDSESDQGGRNGSQEDLFAGKLKYPASSALDLELKGSVLRKTNLANDSLALTSSIVSLASKYRIGGMSIGPEFSIKETNNMASNIKSGEYRAGLELLGETPLTPDNGRLTYQAKGTIHVPVGADQNTPPTVLARCKLAYLFPCRSKKSRSQIALKGEFDGRRVEQTNNKFSVSLSFDLEA